MAWSSPRTWVTGETVTAAHMNQEVRDNLTAAFPDDVTVNTWSPTLAATTTNPTTSGVDGAEYTAGAIQYCWARWVFTAGGSGTWEVTLPSTATQLTASTSTGQGQTIGNFHIVDTASPHMIPGTVTLSTTTTARFSAASVIHGTSSGQITDSTPRSWTTGILHFYAQYPIA